MKRLSDYKFWDNIYEQNVDDQSQTKKSARGPLKSLIKRLFFYERAMAYASSYRAHLEYEVLYKKYLPQSKGLKVLEIGSAPGAYLIMMHEKFGYRPFGVEYSEQGVQANKMLFKAHKLDPDNVIHSDFFADEFQAKYKGAFDIVLSRGFIEHFTDVPSVIDKHLNLLASGGTLLVTIPNFGHNLNYFLARFFNREFLAMHNIDIMEKARFRQLFARNDLSESYCDYHGTFNLGLFNPKDDLLRRVLFKIGLYIQAVLNVFFNRFFKNKKVDHRFFSPYLIFIGQKR